MKRIATAALALLCASAFLSTAAEPAREMSPQEQQAVRLIKEIQEQQATIAANQAQIDQKLATLAEAIRQARIFASRGGKP